MYRDIVGQNIRQYRVAHKWTQEKLGDLLAVSHQVISKWENGIAVPELGMLCAMAKLFEVSLDTLCGLQADDMTIMETARQIAAHDENASFEELLNRLERLKTQLATDPLHEELLMYVLEFAAVIHDRCDSDAQKDRINDEVEALAQRVLDFSGSDDYRSIANYRLALCYLERVDRVRASEADRRCAQKAKEYAARVCYKYG